MFRAQRPLLLLTLAGLTAWIFWLRWPSFGHAFWNLDEGIYATVGRTIVEGGVMYRDAIDHRAPVCHYATALIFAVAGVNNVWAMHVTLAGMIASIAFALFLLGRRWRGSATGLWAAVIFAAFSTDLFYVGDAYSLSTEWFLIFFSSWSTWWFWVNWARAGFWPPFAAGMGYALAFMSKQPGLLEVGAPGAMLVYVAATRRLRLVPAARVLGGLVAGFTTLLALIFVYFWWHDTLSDFYFYGWTYNLIYYGAETSLADRIQAALALPRMLGEEYPLQLGFIILAALGGLHLVTRNQPSEQDKAAQLAAVFLLCWLALSAAGSASAGRVHAHYYIQSLPALALAAAWVLGSATGWCLSPGRWWLRLGSALLLLAAGWNAVAHPLRGRTRPAGGKDVAYRPADFIKAHSRPTDRIIVWGIYPDFYVYADRKPASRYIYTSFQTGVQPGKNTAPDINTDYGAVPGALDELVRELEATRPVFFVDSSLGAQRLFEKYPLHLYPALDRFVREHYAEVELSQFRPHGFRVLMLKDSSRRTPFALAGGAADGRLGEPYVQGLQQVTPTPVEYDVGAAHSGGRLQRLELLANDKVVQGVSFQPTDRLSVKLAVDFGRLGSGRHRLIARATSATGETFSSPALEVECGPESVSPEQRMAFALPTVSLGPPLHRLRAPFGASATREQGGLIFFAHAPSLFSYRLPPEASQLSGGFGFRPGAYAASNPGRTDGAEFTISLVTSNGRRSELLRRMLRPAELPSDRGEQRFICALPASQQGSIIELAISAGPAGNAASDWTYWSNLQLTVAR